MPTRYIMMSLAVPEEHFDMAMGVLSTYPIVGVEESMDQLTVTFDQNDWVEEYRNSIVAECAEVGVTATIQAVRIEEDKNWNEEWERGIEPVVVNERIVIVPEWRAAEFNAPLTLIITPKMSFGTGHHATTRMMCLLLEKYVQTGEAWMDVGTGTGVLAILARKLGASSVYAFDNNEWSVLNARENIDRNNVADGVVLEQVDLHQKELPRVDGIAANLYRHLVIPYAGAFVQTTSPGGVIIISGILKYDADDIVAAFSEQGCQEIERLNETEWCAIAFRTPV
ncbi:50S ribosomal protein L11 methyltransferase [soil metagenome]